MYYINCAHGLVRGIKYYKGEHAIFECTNDVRTAQVWETVKDATHFMKNSCLYVGHYTILQPVPMEGKNGY